MTSRVPRRREVQKESLTEAPPLLGIIWAIDARARTDLRDDG